MHKSSLLRMEWFVNNYISPKSGEKLKVLDVGSYDVNGSYRQFFPDQEFSYQGLDIENGPNVDIVVKSAYNWSKIRTNNYDVVISGQAFEHIEFFWTTLGEMVRVLKKNGLICIIAPNGFAEHRYPVDCYRFFTDGMIALARYYRLRIIHAHTNCALDGNPKWYSNDKADSMLIAKKEYAGKAKKINLKKYKCQPADLDVHQSGLIPYSKKFLP